MAEPSPALPEGNVSAEDSIREQRMNNGEKEVEMVCNDEENNDEYPQIEFCLWRRWYVSLRIVTVNKY